MLTFLTNSSYSVFLKRSFFTTSLSLLKSTEAVPNLPICNLSTLLFKLLKSIGTFFEISMSDSTLGKSPFLAKFDVATTVAFFKVRFCYIIRQIQFNFYFVFVMGMRLRKLPDFI